MKLKNSAQQTTYSASQLKAIDSVAYYANSHSPYTPGLSKE
ncbi:hypothetical protein [Carboxylicivirga sp. RSCT41]